MAELWHGPSLRVVLRANDRAAGLQESQRKNTMTKRTFRLTYINARRPLGVAGCRHLPGAVRTRHGPELHAGTRNLTEASRAIHESNHEPQPIAQGGICPRSVQHILV
jgi:hypothetical protein